MAFVRSLEVERAVPRHAKAWSVAFAFVAHCAVRPNLQPAGGSLPTDSGTVSTDCDLKVLPDMVSPLIMTVSDEDTVGTPDPHARDFR